VFGINERAQSVSGIFVRAQSVCGVN
jgi:hypothetical protein